MLMFDEEFRELPQDVQDALRARLEEVIRLIYGRYNHSLRDYSVKHFTAEQLNGMIYSVFDLAQRLQPLPPEDSKS